MKKLLLAFILSTFSYTASSACLMKTDYDPARTCGSSTETVKNQAELDAYLVDYGWTGSKWKNLKISFDMSGSDIQIHAPCKITLTAGHSHSASATICIDGKKGVHNSNGYTMNAPEIGLLSETENVEAGGGSSLTADNLTMRGFKSTHVGQNVNLVVTNSIILESTGDGSASGAEIRSGSNITATSLNLLAQKNVFIGQNATVNVTGLIRLESTGEFSSSWAEVKSGAEITAGTLELESKKHVFLGQNTIANVTNGVSLLSTGQFSSSDSLIKSGAEVNAASLTMSGDKTVNIGIGADINVTGAMSLTSFGTGSASITEFKSNVTVDAGTLDLVSNKKAKLGDSSITTVIGNFNMEAPECDINSGATINAGSTSGSCLGGTAPNNIPVAVTSEDKLAVVGETVEVNSFGSFDFDGDLLTYSWTLVDKPVGSAAGLSSSSDSTASLTIDLAGDYIIDLVVSDGTDSSDPARVIISTTNRRPIAVAGNSETVGAGSVVILDGSQSSDPDNDPITYFWVIESKPAGSTATLSNSTDVAPEFIVDLAGDYEISLVVNDGNRDSKRSLVVFSTDNTAPIANAGVDQDSFKNATVNLDASGSSDFDNDTLVYSWTLLVKPAGSTAVLANSSTATPSFTTDLLGSYVAQVVVSDGSKTSADVVVIEAKNRIPQAIITNNSADLVPLGTAVNLDALASTDPDGDTISGYQWVLTSKPAGSNATLSAPTNSATSFTPDVTGSYSVSLVVNDSLDDSSSVSITVNGNAAPIANGGADFTGNKGESVDLDGAASSDSDGETLTYSWTVVSRPAESLAQIANPDTVNPMVILDKDGTYTFGLVVNDGNFDSAQDTVSITVSTPVNNPPTLNPIGNKAVDLGSELVFTMTGSDPEGDDLVFTAANLNLPVGASLNGMSGEFKWKPSATQTGVTTITFQLSDGTNFVTETINITVNAPAPNSPTNLMGRVLDAESSAMQGQDVAVVGAKVFIEGTAAITFTDANGFFTLTDIPPDFRVFKIDASTSQPAPDGKAYANFIEGIKLIDNADNVESRPFYIPRIDPAGSATVSPGESTMVDNTNIGVSMELPAQTAKNPDGSDFSGQINISEVPEALAPVALPDTIRPGQLITIQPAGLQFDQPVPIRFPNSSNLLPGSEVNIFSVDALSGQFAKVGRARVTDDGQYVETISGGIRNTSWHLLGPDEPDLDEDEDKDEEDEEDCNCKKGSRISLSNSVLMSDHELVSYKSLNTKRSLNLSYSHNTAFPTPTVGVGVKKGFAVSPPISSSLKLEVGGVDVSDEIFMDTAGGGLPASTYKQRVQFDGSQFSTGVYNYDALVMFNYPNNLSMGRRLSSVSSRKFEKAGISVIDDSPKIAIVNYKESVFGVGWTETGIERLHIQSNGDLMLVNKRASYAIFRRLSDGSYLSPLSDYSIFTKLDSGNYERKMKNGLRYIFDSEGLLISIKDRNQNEMIYCYFDGTDRIKFIQDPIGLKTNFVYGPDGLVDKIVDPYGRESLLEHNSHRQLVKITHPDLTEESFQYDSKNRMISKRDKGGVVTNYLYNSLNKIVSLVRGDGSLNKFLSQDSNGLPDLENSGTQGNPLPQNLASEEKGTFTAGNGSIESIRHNKFGTPVSREDSLGRVYDSVRDVDNNEIESTDPNGNLKRAQYDSNGNPTSIINVVEGTRIDYSYESKFNLLATRKNQRGELFNFIRDSKGNLVKEINPDGTFIKRQFNSRGQITSETDENGNSTTFYYSKDTGNLLSSRDTLGNERSLTYDGFGNISSIMDENGQLIEMTYDLHGRVLSRTNQNSELTEFSYDPYGKIKTVKDSRGKVTTLYYDSEQRMIKRVNPLGFFIERTYDNNGNITSETTQNGNIIVMEYDSEDQLIKKTFSDGKIVNYTYDENGNILSVEDQNSKITYEYDSENRIVSESTEGSPYQPSVKLVFKYDETGNRVSLQAPFGNVVYSYDDRDRIKSLLSFSGGEFGFEYDNLSRRIGLSYPSGVKTKSNFDALSRVTSISHEHGMNVLASFGYSYDNKGNKTSSTVHRLGISNLNIARNYSYDFADQLVEATSPFSNEDDEIFSYDSLGNRLRKTGDLTNAIYGDNNQILQNEEFTFSYDNDGNLLEKVYLTTGGVTRYTWDTDGQLVQITKHANTTSPAFDTVSYLYDAIGRRIRKIVNGIEEIYIYDGKNIVSIYNDSFVLKSIITHGLRDDEPLEVENEGVSHYYHLDGLGSTIALSNQNGEFDQNYVYNSFGEASVFDKTGVEIQLDEGVENLYGYTSRELDPESDLYHYRARYFDSNLGRFISTDPIHFSGLDENLYRYVFNQPGKYTDPSGLVCAGLPGVVACAVMAAMVASAVRDCQKRQDEEEAAEQKKKEDEQGIKDSELSKDPKIREIQLENAKKNKENKKRKEQGLRPL